MNTSQKYFVAAGITAIALAISLLSCNSNDNLPKEVKGKVVAFIIRRDSSRPLMIMWREIRVWAKIVDSAAKKYEIVADTIWIPPTTVPIIDSATGRAKFDSITKKPLIDPEPKYFYENRWPNDSVVWDISGKDFDSLSKKR